MFALVKILLVFSSLSSTYGEGTPLYNHYTERCCAGTIRPLPIDRVDDNYECCGSELYYKSEEDYEDPSELVTKCCRDTLYENVNSTASCCGTKLYEPSAGACYRWGKDGFEVVPLSEDDAIKGKTKVCGKSEGEGECYNPAEQICCSGILNPKEENMRCCGDQYIDETVFKCCVDYEKDEGTEKYKKVTSVVDYNGVAPRKAKCCNGKIIDAEKQECCADGPVDFPANFTKPSFNYYYDDLFSEDYSEDSSEDHDWFAAYSYRHRYSGCCGQEVITDRRKQVCEHNERLVNLEDRKRNQVYCGGQLRNISGDKERDLHCVKGDILPLGPTEKICSVPGNNETYDTRYRVCGWNELIDRTDDDRKYKREHACYDSKDRFRSTVVDPDGIYLPKYNLAFDYNF